MVERRLVRSRSAARDLIRRGEVLVDGESFSKPGALVAARVRVDVDAVAASRVSRGGDKLAAALEAFQVDGAGCVCLDLGASTGGFVQELLARSALRVYALDVGRDQMHKDLAVDQRVINLEGVDARTLDRSLVPEPIDLIVADLSFISLTLALPAALALTRPGGILVALVKPQFELERASIGKGGVVRDAAERARALSRVRDWLDGQTGWRVIGEMPSPIKGAGGNQEFFLFAQLDR